MGEVFPPPIRLPGEPEPRREMPEQRHYEPPEIVDIPIDAYGAEAAAANLAERLARVGSGTVHVADPGLDLLAPPFARDRDRVDGAPWARSTLGVFGAPGTPSSRPPRRGPAAMRAPPPPA